MNGKSRLNIETSVGGPVVEGPQAERNLLHEIKCLLSSPELPVELKERLRSDRDVQELFARFGSEEGLQNG